MPPTRQSTGRCAIKARSAGYFYVRRHKRPSTALVSELKVDVGPGYRVYYSQRGDRLLLLIAGGDKSTQAKDIARALELNRNYVE